MSDKYTIGLDFGTLSVRAAIVRVRDGEEMSTGVSEYRWGAMESALTAGDGKPLPSLFALQNPADYLESMCLAIRDALHDAPLDPADIVGLATDFTSATVIVTDEDGQPLCQQERFRNHPHAYAKLWKHHGGQEQADRIVALAKERGETWLARYGGTLSSELLLPKALELLEDAPEVYEATAHIVNAVDWIIWRLTGRLAYAEGDSGYKRMFQDGQYPSSDFLRALNPDFGEVFSSKMAGPVVPLGSRVAGLSPEVAQQTGLPAGIAVAAGNIDAHVTAAAVQAVAPGQLTGIMGTSTCWVVSSPHFAQVPGIFGAVEGGIVPGLWGYEAGQTAVGDIFAWFVQNCVPESYFTAAREAGLSIHQYLTELGKDQPVGGHGLLALDWFNGNRSILVDAKLGGLVVGMNLNTKPEEIYRALLESTAFGARIIIENFINHGVEITEVVASGGLIKNQTLMQMYSDITKLPLSVAVSPITPAVGSAIFAAVAAGQYPDIFAASRAMGRKIDHAYHPNPQRSATYDQLFADFKTLHDYFGKDAKQIMHRLNDRRASALRQR